MLAYFFCGSLRVGDPHPFFIGGIMKAVMKAMRELSVLRSSRLEPAVKAALIRKAELDLERLAREEAAQLELPGVHQVDPAEASKGAAKRS